MLAWGLGLAALGFGGPRTAAQDAPPDAPALRVARRIVTVLEAEPQTRTLAVLERVELVNDGAEPFVPRPGGPQGPMGVLRFALPRNAFDLMPDPQLGAHELVQVDRGFGSFMPVPPGETTVSFSYRVPYAGTRLDLALGTVYPTAALWLLVPADLAVESPDLRLEQTVDIGRLRYQVLVAEGLAAGQRVVVVLAGLPFTPRPWWLDETVQRAVALALAGLGVVGAGAYARACGPRPARPGLPEAP